MDLHAPQKRLAVKVMDKKVFLPPYYSPVEEMPFNPYESEIALGFGTKSENALCFIAITPIPLDMAMDYNDPGSILEYCREEFGDNQGVIEIDTGRTNAGYRYVYSLVKTRLDVEGEPLPVVTYTLNMHVDYRDFTLSVVGNFEEAFNTGVRHSIGAMIISKQTGLELGSEEWFRDPYNPEWRKGFLMHLAEHRMFDAMFSQHPLSIARELTYHVSKACHHRSKDCIGGANNTQ
ncbi:MAG: hypothetical protein IJ125_09335 [Atopobiaceae bacterium]|nr:hypothetical protein [Atopobiaceae bacterium]